MSETRFQHDARRDAVDVRLLDHGGERLLGRAAWLQKGGEVAALAKLRNFQVHGADTGFPRPLPVAVALVDTCRCPLAVRGAGQPLDLHVQHAICEVGHHLSEEIVVAFKVILKRPGFLGGCFAWVTASLQLLSYDVRMPQVATAFDATASLVSRPSRK